MKENVQSGVKPTYKLQAVYDGHTQSKAVDASNSDNTIQFTKTDIELENVTNYDASNKTFVAYYYIHKGGEF